MAVLTRQRAGNLCFLIVLLAAAACAKPAPRKIHTLAPVSYHYQEVQVYPDLQNKKKPLQARLSRHQARRRKHVNENSASTAGYLSEDLWNDPDVKHDQNNDDWKSSSEVYKDKTQQAYGKSNKNWKSNKNNNDESSGWKKSGVEDLSSIKSIDDLASIDDGVNYRQKDERKSSKPKYWRQKKNPKSSSWSNTDDVDVKKYNNRKWQKNENVDNSWKNKVPIKYAYNRSPAVTEAKELPTNAPEVQEALWLSEQAQDQPKQTWGNERRRHGYQSSFAGAPISYADLKKAKSPIRNFLPQASSSWQQPEYGSGPNKQVVSASQNANAYKRAYNRGQDTITNAKGDLNTEGQRIEYGFAELEGYGLKDYKKTKKGSAVVEDIAAVPYVANQD